MQPATTTKGEPAVITGLAAAAIEALVFFTDIGLTTDEQGALAAAITIVAGFIIRSKVRPIA